MEVKNTGKKTVLISAIICTVVGLGLATLYWRYPPFGEAITATGALISATVIDFVMSSQPVWMGLIIGGAIVGVVSIFIAKGYFSNMKWGFRKSMEPIYQNTPTTSAPIPILSQPVASNLAPAVEVKPEQ